MHKKKQKPNSISEFQQYINDLHIETNKNKSWTEIYGFLSRTSGYLVKNMVLRKQQPEHFIRPISWLFSLANKLNISLEDSFLKKYPSVCPYCIEHMCICSHTDKQPKRDIPAWKIGEEINRQYEAIKPFGDKNFSYAIETINSIYPCNFSIWQFAGAWRNSTKLYEEISELHEALTKFQHGKKTLKNVEDEFADVLAWIMSSWHCSFKDCNFDDAFIHYYIQGCPVCLSSPCKCIDGSNRTHELVDVAKLEKLRQQLEELNLQIPNNKELIDDLIHSVTAAKDTQNEAAAVIAVKQTQSRLDTIAKTIESTEGITEKTAKIVKSIAAISGYIKEFL